jgi:phosphatidylinositol alpha-1,6-mannosyltransferase
VKVLALVTDAFGGFGGIARYNQDLFGALASLGAIEAIVALPRIAPDSPYAVPTKVVQLDASRGRFLYILRTLTTSFTVRGIGVVFCGHLFMAPLAALIAGLLGVPLWITVHGIEAWQRPGPLVNWAVKRAALITAVSRHTRRRLLAWAEVSPDRVRVLPNTVGTAFTPGEPPPALVRKFKPRGGKVLLTVGRLTESDRAKGVDRVIGVLPRVVAEVPDVSYVIIGDGPDRAYLEELSKQRGVRDCVHFVGRVAADELAGYYRLADAFAMPSVKEGFGIVLLEAAASGAAVIGGDRDGAVDALAEGSIGAMVNPESDSALFAAIRAALQAPRPTREHVLRFRPENFRSHLSRLIGQLEAADAR